MGYEFFWRKKLYFLPPRSQVLIMTSPQCQIFRARSVFYFPDNSLTLCYSSCFCLVFPYGDSSSTKKLNGHQAFDL